MADTPATTLAPGILAGCPRCGARGHLEESTGHGDAKRQHSLWRVRCEAECHPAMETEWLPSAVAAARAWNAATPLPAHAVIAMPRTIDQWRNMIPEAVRDGSPAQVLHCIRDARTTILAMHAAMQKACAVTWHPIDTAPRDRPVLLRGGRRSDWVGDGSPDWNASMATCVARWQGWHDSARTPGAWVVAWYDDCMVVDYQNPTEWAEVPA